MGYPVHRYLYNKNVLEYAQISRNGPKSMPRDIKGLSINYVFALIFRVPLSLDVFSLVLDKTAKSAIC